MVGVAHPASFSVSTDGRSRRGQTERTKGRQRLLTYEEEADYLAVGRTTVYDLVGKGELPAVKIGRCTRLRPENLEELLKAKLTRPKR